jgi:hypothetical protein
MCTTAKDHCAYIRAGALFSNYTIHWRHSQHTHTHPYEYTYVNPTPVSIFKDCAGIFSRLTKSPHAPRCRRERRLPLKAKTPLNPEKFTPTGSRTQDLCATGALLTTRLQTLSPCWCTSKGYNGKIFIPADHRSCTRPRG